MRYDKLLSEVKFSLEDNDNVISNVKNETIRRKSDFLLASDIWSIKKAISRKATREQIEIIKSIGRLLNQDKIKEKLDYSVATSVTYAFDKKKIFFVSFPKGGVRLYPEFQIDLEKKKIRPWIKKILEITDDCWLILSFLSTRRENLNGLSYLSVLLEDESKINEMLINMESKVDDMLISMKKLLT